MRRNDIYDRYQVTGRQRRQDARKNDEHLRLALMDMAQDHFLWFLHQEDILQSEGEVGGHVVGGTSRTKTSTSDDIRRLSFDIDLRFHSREERARCVRVMRDGGVSDIFHFRARVKRGRNASTGKIEFHTPNHDLLPSTAPLVLELDAIVAAAPLVPPVARPLRSSVASDLYEEPLAFDVPVIAPAELFAWKMRRVCGTRQQRINARDYYDIGMNASDIRHNPVLVARLLALSAADYAEQVVNVEGASVDWVMPMTDDVLRSHMTEDARSSLPQQQVITHLPIRSKRERRQQLTDTFTTARSTLNDIKDIIADSPELRAVCLNAGRAKDLSELRSDVAHIDADDRRLLECLAAVRSQVAEDVAAGLHTLERPPASTMLRDDPAILAQQHAPSSLDHAAGTAAPPCGFVGPVSRRPCVLPAGHRGPHRYQSRR